MDSFNNCLSEYIQTTGTEPDLWLKKTAHPPCAGVPAARNPSVAKS